MNQRGQSLVLSVLFLTVLIGLAAIVVDVGSWYRADRKLQANADAAALAGAQELPADRAAAEAAALDYAATNDGGLEAKNVKFRTTNIPNDTIEVTTDRPAPGFFAQLFGRSSVDVRAKAAARAGVLASATGAAPIAVDWGHEMLHCVPQESCWGRYDDGVLVPGTPTTVDFTKTGPGAFRLLNVDGSYGGTGLSDIEAWIRDGFSGPADINQWYYSDPGMKPNSSHVSEALSHRLANEPDLLFPVYDSVQGSGAGFEYHVIGFAVFHVTGFNLHGSKDSYIEGYFMDMVWTGVPSPPSGGGGGGTGFGARAVTLIE
jgi:Putative Flp pilus-assembly TadE/G-like